MHAADGMHSVQHVSWHAAIVLVKYVQQTAAQTAHHSDDIATPRHNVTHTSTECRVCVPNAFLTIIILAENQQNSVPLIRCTCFD